MTANIKITFLGTSDSVPSRARNHTSILLDYEGEHILVDCGEGTQRQFRKAGLNPCKVTRLLITHWHGDHVLGIPGFLQTLSLTGYCRTLFIYGPKGTKKHVQEMLQVFNFKQNFPIEVEEVGEEKSRFFDSDEFYIEAKPMMHGIPCNAYSFVKKGLLRIDKKKIEKLKIPAGKHMQELKKGMNVVVAGKKFKAKDVTYKDEDKKVSFVLDTLMNPRIVPFVKSSDVLISEATFSDEIKESAKEHKHLTAKQVGEIANKANVKKLILTHISQRYSKNLKDILKEAQKEFKDVSLVKDLDVIDV